MDIELLKSFFSKNEGRKELLGPWSEGEYTIATAGKILIRIPKMTEVPENPCAPKTKQLWAAEHLKGELRDLHFEDMKVITGPCDNCKEIGIALNDIDCPDCDGEGACEHCGADCKRCNGFGMIRTKGNADVKCKVCDGTGKKPLVYSFGAASYVPEQIKKITGLPGIQLTYAVANPDFEVGGQIARFKFTGGEGLVRTAVQR